MILIGDSNISCETLIKIEKKEDIENTIPNSTVLFSYDLDTLHYTMENAIQSAVVVETLLEAIYAHNCNVRYIISTQELAIQIQDLADHYMYDSKVLALINSSSEIEELAKKHIDGVIYKKLLG